VIRGPSYKNKIETKGVLLDAAKRVDRGLADFTSLDHGTGKGLGGDDGEPVSVLYQDLHDTSIDGAEDGLGDDGQVHGISLTAHFWLLERMIIRFHWVKIVLKGKHSPVLWNPCSILKARPYLCW
tara:strand:+ start:284 stop:658 length:375 start_codon:yes stop_codon:yes gene_type:complete